MLMMHLQGAPAESYARGIELSLDMNNWTAELLNEFPAPYNNISGSQGSVQLLNNSNWFIGWGVSERLSSRLSFPTECMCRVFIYLSV